MTNHDKTPDFQGLEVSFLEVESSLLCFCDPKHRDSIWAAEM